MSSPLNYPHSYHEFPCLDSTADQQRSPGETAIRSIRAWAREIEDYGWPHFDEFAQRLAAAKADLLNDLTACSGSEAVAEQSEVCQKQQRFLASIDQLVEQLRGSHPGFPSWQEACRAFEGLCEQYCALQQLLRSQSGS